MSRELTPSVLAGSHARAQQDVNFRNVLADRCHGKCPAAPLRFSQDMNAITSVPADPVLRPFRSPATSGGPGPTSSDTRAAKFVREGYLVEERLLDDADLERLL